MKLCTKIQELVCDGKNPIDQTKNYIQEITEMSPNGMIYIPREILYNIFEQLDFSLKKLNRAKKLLKRKTKEKSNYSVEVILDDSEKTKL